MKRQREKDSISLSSSKQRETVHRFRIDGATWSYSNWICSKLNFNREFHWTCKKCDWLMRKLFVNRWRCYRLMQKISQSSIVGEIHARTRTFRFVSFEFQISIRKSFEKRIDVFIWKWLRILMVTNKCSVGFSSSFFHQCWDLLGFFSPFIEETIANISIETKGSCRK